eukprot:5082563-Pyramimonas_sp.AAC.1
MAGTEDTIDKHVKCVDVLGYTKYDDGNVTLDQDEYFKQLRPIQHPELTSADADAQTTRTVADMFVSLRSALAHA